MTEKRKFNFWNIFGKIALIVTLFWTITQIYNWMTEDEGYKIVVNGTHSKFRLPQQYQDVIDGFEKTLDLDQTYRETVNKKGVSIERLLEYYENNNNEEFKNTYHYHKDYTNQLDIKSYNYSWEFQIENTGNKPLEELLLETPFEGSYKVSISNEDNEYGEFKKNIELPDLGPGYSIGVRIWINNTTSLYEEFDEEKTRITHKYGFQQINYPVKVKGFAKWLTKDDNFNMFFVVLLLLVLIFFVFSLGMEYGPKYAEIEKKKKIEEFKKTQKMLEEDAKLSKSESEETDKTSE
jgi:hypothetical protein